MAFAISILITITSCSNDDSISTKTEKIDLIQPLEEIDYILPTNVVIDTIPGDPDNPRPKG